MTARDYALYATAVFCWGTSWLALRIQAVSAAPETAVFWRFVLATAVMGCWVLLAGKPLRFDWRTHARFGLTGIGIFSTNFMLYYHGGRILTSGLLPVLFSLAVVGNLVLGALVLGQKITARLVVAALIGISGIGLMFAAEFGKTAEDANLALGILLCTCGTMSFCIGNTASALSSRAGIDVISSTFWGMIYGTLWTGLVTVLRGESFAIPVTTGFLASMAWLVIVATIAAFWAYLTLTQRIGPARAGYATVMFPVVGLIVSTFLETLVPGTQGNYQWTTFSVVGLALAIVGNVVILKR
jgi:drug/metabolite transporter (DMT)-like permease